MKKLLTPRLNEYIPHVPTPKQAAFLLLNNLDVFYGGAGGGGKTETILMAALQFVDLPNYSALILRDTYKNLALPGAIMDRAHEWLGDTDAYWREEDKRYTFPKGANLTFGYLDGPRDHTNYKSAEFDFIGIDEVVDIRWYSVNYMFSRLRRLKTSTIPSRFRLGSNPDPLLGRCHQELFDKYVNPKTKKKDAVFIPASMRDNPYLDAETYDKNLDNLDPITQRAIRDGIWNIKIQGNFFKREWFKMVDEPPEIVKTIRYWDRAATEAKKSDDIIDLIQTGPAWTCGVKMGITEDNQYCILSVYRFREDSLGNERFIRDIAQKDGYNVEIWKEQEPGSSGKDVLDHYLRNVLPGFALYGDRVTGSKIERAGPLAAHAKMGNVLVLRAHWNEDFFRELELFPGGKFKDQVDASSGAFNKLAIYAVTPMAWGA